MNEISKTANYSLQTPATNEQLGVVITTLFGTMHHENKGDALKAVIGNYIDVLSDIPAWAVSQAADEYRKGLRGDGRFIPMAAELAKAALGLVEANNEKQRIQAKRKRDAEELSKQLAERNRIELHRAGITPASRARVQAKLEAAQKIIAENKLVDDQTKTRRMQHENTHDIFKRHGREALLKNLGMEATQ